MCLKMSFALKLENSRILKVIVETLASIIDETEFKVTPKEFTITAMDPSRICLLKLVIDRKHFDNFECNKETKIGLNLEDLDKILKRSSANDIIDISFNEKEQKIKIKMQRENMKHARTFSLALLDIDAEDVPMDNLLKIEYDSKFSIEPSLFIDAIKDAEIYSEIMNMKTEEKQGLFFNSSGQIGEMEYELALDDLLENDLNDKSTGAYSLRFLKSIFKIAPVVETLEIFLKTDHPLKITFNIIEGAMLTYFLAPRVEEAEFDDEEDVDDY